MENDGLTIKNPVFTRNKIWFNCWKIVVWQKDEDLTMKNDEEIGG